jgi:hypothetical protein
LFRRSTKPSLYLRVEQIKALVQKRGWVLAYRHVPRMLNTQPDDMCRRARQEGKDVEYKGGNIPPDAPPLEVAALY